MLQIPQSVYRQLRHHGETAYPEECCGILLGTVRSQIKDEIKMVIKAVPVANAASSPRNRYAISSLDIIRIEREARLAGCEILGFYHSHPDYPAHWSTTDLAEAHWLGCSYLITRIGQGTVAETRSFHLAGTGEEDKRFEPEEICVQP